jgi:hypothetical protein
MITTTSFLAIICTAILAATCLPSAIAETTSIHSPDQQFHVRAGLDDSGAFRYALEAFGKPLVLPSAAAIQPLTPCPVLVGNSSARKPPPPTQPGNRYGESAR